MKILPNEKPELKIEKSIENEDKELKNQTELEEPTTHQIDAAIETNEIDSVLLTTPTTTTKPQTSSIIITPTLDIFTTANAATGSNEEITTSQKVNTEQSATIIVTDDDVMITEYKDLEKTVTQHATLDMDIQTDIIDVTRNNDDIEIVNTIKSIDSREKEKYGTDEEKSTERSDSFEDYSEEVDLKPTNVKHKARQHTLPSSTLLHGFIANPGYPSYYIGSDRDCKWKIIIAKGQKMMLTILDLHLRGK